MRSTWQKARVEAADPCGGEAETGRIQKASKNIAAGYMGQAISSLMGFALRTVFIMRLPDTLLGVNGLYSSILSMLSLAELGVGTAMNYSLYAPMAAGDTEKLKSYMAAYKKAYRYIALAIAAIGLALTPFLKFIVGAQDLVTERQLVFYYLIFLFNTVSTYFVSYKYGLCWAEQKNYIQTNILTATKIATALAQMAVILATGNFTAYLLTGSAVQVLQILFVSFYLDRKYPYLRDREHEPLTAEESGELKNKTKALMLHKVGDTARLQTDAIIISSFINVVVVGIVDNYNMIINTASSLAGVIFNSVITSFGNLIATEDREKQYDAFRIYRFAAVWLYGFLTAGFCSLLTPLVRLCWGDKWALGNAAVYLILMDFYFKGERIVLSNFKTAAGVFEPDRYLALIQGAVNLVLSVALVIKIGLPGVYIGTVVSGLIANITKPVIIYRHCFGRGCSSYFRDSAGFDLFTFALVSVCVLLQKMIMKNATVLTFGITMVVVTLVFNGAFLLVFGRSYECGRILGLIRRRGK